MAAIPKKLTNPKSVTKKVLVKINGLFGVINGGVDTRSRYMRYVPVISANILCMYYVHRDIYGTCTFLVLFRPKIIAI